MKNTLALIFIAGTAGILGPQLDAGSFMDDLQDRAAQAEEHARAIAQAEHRQRFERAARIACGGGEVGWYEVAPGVVDCATKRGKRTQRGVQVSASE